MHEAVLETAYVLFEREVTWMAASKWKGTWLARPGEIRPDDTEFRNASAAARTAWYELDSLVLGVEAKLKGDVSAATGQLEVSNPPDRITFDDATSTITLDGTQFRCETPKAYQIVKLLWEHLGETTHGKTIRDNITGLRATNALSATIKTLPRKIKDCVKSDTRNGYWLALPEK